MNTISTVNKPIDHIHSPTKVEFYDKDRVLFDEKEQLHAKPCVQFISDDTSCTSDDDTRSSSCKRKNTKYSPECLAYLHQWLAAHLHNPYPDREEIECLAVGSGLSREQVNNWFTNTRKRKLKMNGKKIPAESGIHGLKHSTLMMDSTKRKRGGMRMSPLPTDFIQRKYAIVSPGMFAPTTPRTSQLCYVPLVTPNSINMSGVDKKVKHLNNVHKRPLFCADDLIDTEMTDAEIHSLLNDSNEIWANRLTTLVTDVMEADNTTLMVCHVPKPAASRYILKDISRDSEPFFKKSKNEVLWNVNVDGDVKVNVDIENFINFDVDIANDNEVDIHFNRDELDNLEVNLGILDDVEGGDDEWGIMADLYSQNM